jgi:dTDP-4-amino-4,6-dideoxygalactose transaminase
MTKEPDGPWYYQQVELGYNYRMTELQAALGISQMTRVDEFVAQRHHLAKRYYQALESLPLTLPWQHPDSYSGLHLFVIRLNLEQSKLTHRDVFEALRTNGIGVNLHYIPVHTQPYYEAFGFKENDFPEAMKYYVEAISLPMFHGMTVQQQDEVISVLKEVLQ